MNHTYNHVTVCNKEVEINHLIEDVATVKAALGYKDKSNGEFRQEIDEEQKTINERMYIIEKSTIEMKATLDTAITSMRWTIGVGFGGIVSAILLLLSLHV